MLNKKLVKLISLVALALAGPAKAGEAKLTCPGQPELVELLQAYFDKAQDDSSFWTGQEQAGQNITDTQTHVWHSQVVINFPSLKDNAQAVRDAVMGNIEHIANSVNPQYTSNKQICAYTWAFSQYNVAEETTKDRISILMTHASGYDETQESPEGVAPTEEDDLTGSIKEDET